jgi:phosphoglycolate phosphatase
MTDVLNGARIVFDLDGTLVDTAPDLVRALNAVIGAEGLPPISIELVRSMVGRGARRLIQRAFEHNGRPLTDAQTATLTAKFLDIYRAEIDVESAPFPCMIEALDELDARGAALSVATNKPTDLAVLLLTRLGLVDRFERVLGPDAVAAKKPDGGHILAAAGPGASADRIILVGDSDVDVAAARSAGCAVIIMSYGYTEMPATELGADQVLDDCRTLVPALEALLSARV